MGGGGKGLGGAQDIVIVMEITNGGKVADASCSSFFYEKVGGSNQQVGVQEGGDEVLAVKIEYTISLIPLVPIMGRFRDGATLVINGLYSGKQAVAVVLLGFGHEACKAFRVIDIV